MIHLSRRLMTVIMVVAAASVLCAANVSGQTEGDLSPTQEARYHELLEELRCLVCQNQSLAESDAELAGDLRAEVLRMVTAGHSNDEVFTFMTDRYGSFVRYRPPFNWTTLLLWFAPFIVLLVSLVFLFKQIAKRNQSSVS